MLKGIDVSSYQGDINWEKVKVDFAIIRCGYGDDVLGQDDKYFINNVNGCIKNNIPFGVYIYSYAKNLSGTASIDSEVRHCQRLLGNLSKRPFVVYIDMEDDSTSYLSKDVLTNYALEFCKRIESFGYKAGVYANLNWFNNYLDGARLKQNGYSIWCAKYSEQKPDMDFCDMWQYSDKGRVEGIKGVVDMNYMYNDIRGIGNKNVTQNDDKVNVYYRVRTKDYGWLREVRNLDDYAGYKASPVTGLAIKVDKGTVKYRVHVKGGSWLSYVKGYNINDFINGYAGNGKVIDAVEVYYYTPLSMKKYKRAKYRVNNYSFQYDNEKKDGQDGYAGKMGVAVIKFQIIIE